jgi:hypothetical protein
MVRPFACLAGRASGGVYKKGRRLFARGLKFCVFRMSAILPTTGPAKIKVEAKAEGVGFIQESSGGSMVEHRIPLEGMPLCYTQKKRAVNRKS